MANRLDNSDDDYAIFINIQTLEQQAMYLLIKVAMQENLYNTANPDKLQNRATIATNYDARTVTAQLSLNLSDLAMNNALHFGCLPYLP